MKKWSKLLAALLAAILSLTMFPVLSLAADGQTPQEISPESYDALDRDVWARIEALEQKEVQKSTKAADYAALLDKLERIIKTSSTYVSGSLKRNGDSLTWMTDTGVACRYSPRLRAKAAGMQAPAKTKALPADYTNTTTSDGVTLIGPFYGVDDSFTDAYADQAQALAKTYNTQPAILSGAEADIDAVAQAIQTSAIVLIDSHGDADFDEEDQATASYLCLTTANGLTYDDYQSGEVFYSSSESGEEILYVTGDTIARHMTANAPTNMVWMGMCFSMSTNTIEQPLRSKGVEVCYGYSQDVTFGGDRCFLQAFWQQIRSGGNVTQAVEKMKQTYGCWDASPEICRAYDWSDPVYTLDQALQGRWAFPIVTSSQDAYPGVGTVDGYQTVASTWNAYGITYPYGDLIHRNVWYTQGIEYAIAQNLFNGTSGNTFSPSQPMSRAMLVTVLWRMAGQPAPTAASPYTDVATGSWYEQAVHWAWQQDVVKGVSDTRFAPEQDVSREQIAVLLARYAQQIQGKDTQTEGDLTAFADADTASAWAEDALIWATNTAPALISGKGDASTLAPKESASRAEVAVILCRYSQIG